MMVTFSPTKPRYWFRYVDETFVIILEVKVPEFTAYINNRDRNIRFTSDLEQNGNLQFLDVEVVGTHESGVKLQVYKKRTHIDQYLSFNSNYSLSSAV